MSVRCHAQGPPPASGQPGGAAWLLEWGSPLTEEEATKGPSGPQMGPTETTQLLPGLAALGGDQAGSWGLPTPLLAWVKLQGSRQPCGSAWAPFIYLFMPLSYTRGRLPRAPRPCPIAAQMSIRSAVPQHHPGWGASAVRVIPWRDP